MATKEEPVAGVQAPLPPAGLAVDQVKQEPITHQHSLDTSVTTVYSEASPPPLSPQTQFPAFASQVYPNALASHEAVIADEKLFMETFYSFHTALKHKPTIPKMGGKDLDVHLLYREVTSRGGLQAVIRDRKWKEVTLVFDFPPTTTSASFVLRKYYMTLLYHYEQVYKNGVTGPLLTPPAALSGSSPSVQPGDPALSEGGEPVIRKRVRKRRLAQPQLPAVDPAEAIGATVTGAIEGKLEFGYLVTMVVGGEQLKGVLYHVPPGSKQAQYATLPGLLNSLGSELGGQIPTRRKRRRKDEMPKKDPNAPRPNRTGYNFFFAEQRQRLKALHPEKDREISRMIGEAWNALSEADKMPYQERGLKDKERFKREFRDYREKMRIGFYDNPANGQGLTAKPVALSEVHSIPDRPIEPNHSSAMPNDTPPASENLPFGPKQMHSDPSAVIEQKPVVPPSPPQ